MEPGPKYNDEHLKACKKYVHSADACILNERTNTASCNGSYQSNSENRLQSIHDQQSEDSEEADSDEEVSKVIRIENETLLLGKIEKPPKIRTMMKHYTDVSKSKIKSSTLYADSGTMYNIVGSNMAQCLTNIRNILERKINSISGSTKVIQIDVFILKMGKFN
eukprot:snap_masked-scaffold_88-processed-gene-0.38-mRNA-1 protein AED:1.00 eAED:1.00 QI:0/-1/0/0/-1/1/1/0/163